MFGAHVFGPGHPDAACDAVAAAIVEEHLRRDPMTQANIRVTGGHGALFVAGEVRSTADFDVSSVVRRALGMQSVSASLEPFVSLEALPTSWSPEQGSKEPMMIFGYASSETELLWPKSVFLARDLAQELERKRTGDPEWFWLGSDYEVLAQNDSHGKRIMIRAEHVDAMPLAEVRKALIGLVSVRCEGSEVVINPGGVEITAGLGNRIGSSHEASGRMYGALLPSNPSGAGRQILHPANVGSWMARAVARELVRLEKGKAVMVQLGWLPLESTPRFVHIRNERGQDLSSLVDVQRFDLTRIPESWHTPTLIVSFLRAEYDGSVMLPWES